MEFFSVLLMILILVIIINQNSKTSTHLQKLEDELKLLRRQLLNFSNEKKEISEINTPEKPQPIDEIKPHVSIFSVVEEQVVVNPPPTDKDTIKPAKETPESSELLQPKITLIEVKETITEPKPAKQPVAASTFSDRHPDLEKFIGENLVSKIGIAILVLAIGFFVKYAIDQNWIGPVARVSIGILCGAILVALAHRFRNTYRGFSSVLAGGGIAVFYFTITLAFQQFQLFSQATAFIIMIVITIFAVLLALLYDKQELAVIALIGGFSAPFLVSTGTGNYKVLFTYLIILNSGLLVMAYNKGWRLLNFLNFIFTVFMFASWLVLLYAEPAITYLNGFLFATIFYLLFLVINIAYNIKEKKKFIASDFGILLANTALYFSAGIYCLIKSGSGDMKGLFSASLGMFNLVLSYVLFRKQKVDSNILYLLIGITLTFISITAPIQLQGNYITIFWASEAALLYWLFTKSKIRIIQFSSGLIWLLMLISLVMDWLQLYGPFGNDNSLPIIINKGFITTLFAALATYVLFLTRSKEDESIKAISSAAIPGKTTFRIFAIVLLFAAGALEINHQFNAYYPGINLSLLYLLLYSFIFVHILIGVTQKINLLKLSWQVPGIMYAVCILLYLMGTGQTYTVQAQILTDDKNGIHFIAHWLSALLIALMVYRFINLVIENKTSIGNSFSFIIWVICALVVIFLSVEVHLLANNIFYTASNSLENIQRVYIKTGLPILWGIASFVFMWLGMRFKFRTLRIISLSLFTITLLKLFIFDIKNIPAGGKIAAFFCLGVLLLVVSFMYQRLKKIIIDEEKVD